MDASRDKGPIDKPEIDMDEVKVNDDDANRLAPAQRISEEEFRTAEKRLKLKLDLRLLLCVFIIFTMNYLD